MQVLGDSGEMDALKASMEEKFMANNPSKVFLHSLLFCVLIINYTLSVSSFIAVDIGQHCLKYSGTPTYEVNSFQRVFRKSKFS